MRGKPLAPRENTDPTEAIVAAGAAVTWPPAIIAWVAFGPYNTRGFKKFGGSVGPDTDEEGYLLSLADTKKRVKAVEALIVSFCQVSTRWVCLPNLRRGEGGFEFCQKIERAIVPAGSTTKIGIGSRSRSGLRAT